MDANKRVLMNVQAPLYSKGTRPQSEHGLVSTLSTSGSKLLKPLSMPSFEFGTSSYEYVACAVRCSCVRACVCWCNLAAMQYVVSWHRPADGRAATAAPKLTRTADYGKHKDMRCVCVSAERGAVFGVVSVRFTSSLAPLWCRRDPALQFHLSRKEISSRSAARQQSLQSREQMTPIVPTHLDIPLDVSSSFMPPPATASTTTSLQDAFNASHGGFSKSRAKSPVNIPSLASSIPDVSQLAKVGLDMEVPTGPVAYLDGTSIGLAHLNVSRWACEVACIMAVNRDACVVALHCPRNIMRTKLSYRPVRMRAQKISRAGSRDGAKLRNSYLSFATHSLQATPTEASFGMLRIGTEYCLPISLKNTSLSELAVRSVLEGRYPLGRVFRML